MQPLSRDARLHFPIADSQRMSPAQASELERLSKLSPAEQVHAEMVAQMLPGTALQLPPWRLFASCTTLLASPRGSQLKAAEGGGGEPS
jgi:hypothetical protein